MLYYFNSNKSFNLAEEKEKMILKIIAKNEKGTIGLREILRDSRGRIKRTFYKVTVIEDNPFTINFELTKI